jgi:hypothetical protein
MPFVRYGDWMNYWILQTTDPSDVDDIREGEDDTWRASQNRQQMTEGDLAFFWLGGPPEIRGVYGWGTLLSGSQPGDDQFEVRVRYGKVFASHLSALTIKERNGPESLRSRYLKLKVALLVSSTVSSAESREPLD